MDYISPKEIAAAQKWDRRFLDMAELVASWSKDPRTRVGCVAVKDRRVVSTGYNGFPSGVRDTEDRLTDPETKYKLVVHAEVNALYSAAKNGVSLEGATLYVHGLPCCHDCAKAIVQSGIASVHMEYGTMLDKWRESFEWSKLIFAEGGVQFRCTESGTGLPDGPHREPRGPGPGDEPVGEP
jgi:dCMP deaminase